MLTFLSHFAFALAQCTQAIGIRSVGDSMAGCRSLAQCLAGIVFFDLDESESPLLYEAIDAHKVNER